MKTIYVQNATILVIDDNPINLEVLCNYLTNKGAKVLVKKSGERGIDCAIRKQPDIILLDIIMPNMDGYETCRRLKQEATTKAIPVIFASALVETIDKLKGFQLGGVDYVTKPIQVEEVLARIETHLSIIGLQKKLAVKNQLLQQEIETCYQLGKQLLSTKQSLEKNYIKQKGLTHILCHDLRNSVAQVHTLLELKKLTPDSEAGYNLLIEKSTHNTLDIIDLVGELSALKEGKKLVKLRPENLQSLIVEAIAMVDDKLRNKNITVELKIDKNNQVNVERVSFINSVMVNLLTNAIKFSHADTKIIIATENTDTHILLTIEDFGIGMPEELYYHIFDTNISTTRSGTNGEIGIGFGMPLVKQFIEMYQGTIVVISEEKDALNKSHGTTFIITLPKV